MGRSKISNKNESGGDAEKAPARRKGQSRVLRAVLLGLLLLPAFLAPNHPVAVYGYLAETYLSPMGRPVHAGGAGDLEPFLVSDTQVARYRAELLEDMAETTSGKLFAIARTPGGDLEHAEIRTWNGFLPNSLPAWLTGWLDRKELPFLGDHVALWLDDKDIVAMGHYHVYGGGPSHGDHIAQGFSELPEVVVSNGIVPLVYLRGVLLSYGTDVTVTPDLFQALRTLERGITMEVGFVPVVIDAPSDGMRTVLAYFRDRQGVDITRRGAVAEAILAHCDTFKSAYAPHFPAGFVYGPYRDCPDRSSVVTNLTSMVTWSDYVRASCMEGQ